MASVRTEAVPKEQRVIEAAIEVFWEKGYSAGSVREISGRAGLPKTSFYRVFASKDDLLFRIFEDSHRRSLQMMREVSHTPVGPLEQLRLYVERFIVYYVENIKSVGLYYRERRLLGEEWAASIEANRRDYDAFVRGLIEDARNAGEADRELEPALATFFVLGALNDISEWYEANPETSAEAFAASYAEIALAAVTGP